MLIIHNTTYTYSNYIVRSIGDGIKWSSDIAKWQRTVEEFTHLEINVQSDFNQDHFNQL